MDQFIDKAKAVQICLLEYIDDEIEYQNFLNDLEQYQLLQNKYEFKTFLYIILNISNNHKRSPSFFTKIEKILLFYKSEILHFFTNSEIFHIFKSNKRILLFLIENGILNIDESIFKRLNNEEYHDYFLPELNRFSNQTNMDELETSNFYANRKNGENHSYICQMIRDDSVVEFITYINRTNLSLSSEIASSIFETNQFLINRSPNLIEYSAFFGSFQIFHFLYNNSIELYKNLWVYAIHGRNPEILHFLEKDGINPDEKFMKESIKCYHNEITNYLFETYSNNTYLDSLFRTGVKYYNFMYFPQSVDVDLLFYTLCGSDNYYLVDYLIKTSQVNINYKKKIKSLVSFSYRFNSYEFKSKKFVTPINAAAKKMNLDILSLLLNQKNIDICEYCFAECDQLETLSIPFLIEKIEDYAFYNCTSLTDVSIPFSVDSIGDFAFYMCKSLVRIKIPSSVTSIGNKAFYQCSSLREISIPFTVTEIKICAFYECSSLTQVTLPSTLAKIEFSAFEKCSKLEKVHFVDPPVEKFISYRCSSVQQITKTPSYIFQKTENESFFSSKLELNQQSEYKCERTSFYSASQFPRISIPFVNNELTIGNSAFLRCSSLKEFIFPYSKISVDNCAFYGCTSLETVIIPSSVISIEINAFGLCESLLQISIPSSVTSIKSGTFYGCSSLKQITFPSSITCVEEEAFRFCTSLDTVSFESPSSLSSIGEYAFAKCTSLKEISIPPSVSEIKRGCFAGCSSLSKILIPESVSQICCFAFNGCTSLSSISLPLHLQRIQKCAFKNCKSLKQIIIPETVENIEKFAFYGCESLYQATILSYVKFDDLSFPQHTLTIQFY